MIVSIILITYCIIMCWWCYSWIRKNTFFSFKTYIDLYINIIIIILFIVVFIFFIRLLSLFRQHKTINLISFNMVFDIKTFCLLLLVLFFFYSLRRLVFYFFKTRWFKLHYFFLSPVNTEVFYKFYDNFFVNIIYNSGIKMYKYLKIINIFFILIILIFFAIDIIYNHGILDKSLFFLKYYSVFKLLHILSKFFYEKQNLILDYYFHNIIYPGIIDKDPFHTIMDPKHRKVMEEAIVYKRNMIMELTEYKPKKIDYTDNDYYRYLNSKIEFVKIYSSFDAFVENIVDKKKKKKT